MKAIQRSLLDTALPEASENETSQWEDKIGRALYYKRVICHIYKNDWSGSGSTNLNRRTHQENYVCLLRCGGAFLLRARVTLVFALQITTLGDGDRELGENRQTNDKSV